MAKQCLVQNPFGGCAVEVDIPDAVANSGIALDPGSDFISGLRGIPDAIAGFGNNLSDFGDDVPGDIFKGVVRLADEGIGELTGRNRARQGDYEARVRFEKEAMERAKLLKEEQARRQQEDLAASMSAESVRRSSGGRGRASLSYSEGLATNKDFLGL